MEGILLNVFYVILGWTVFPLVIILSHSVKDMFTNIKTVAKLKPLRQLFELITLAGLMLILIPLLGNVVDIYEKLAYEEGQASSSRGLWIVLGLVLNVSVLFFLGARKFDRE